VVGSGVNDNKHSSIIKRVEFLDKFADFQLLEKGSTPRSYFVK